MSLSAFAFQLWAKTQNYQLESVTIMTALTVTGMEQPGAPAQRDSAPETRGSFHLVSFPSFILKVQVQQSSVGL